MKSAVLSIRRTACTLRVNDLDVSILFLECVDDTLVWADEIAGLQGRRTAAAEHDCLCIATNNCNLLQSLLLDSC